MDPRHKLTKSLDQLFVDKENPAIMSARTDDEAARTAASSGVTPDAIKLKLEQHLGATHVEIEDMSGTCRITDIFVSLNFLCIVWSQKAIYKVTRPRANNMCRRLWADVRSDHCLAAVHQEDHTGKTPTGECSAEGGDCGHPRLDAKVLHARAVGGEEAAMSHAGARWGSRDHDQITNGWNSRNSTVSERMGKAFHVYVWIRPGLDTVSIKTLRMHLAEQNPNLSAGTRKQISKSGLVILLILVVKQIISCNNLLLHKLEVITELGCRFLGDILHH